MLVAKLVNILSIHSGKGETEQRERKRVVALFEWLLNCEAAVQTARRA